ncbi:MAG: DUF4252 domain-containing protein, partial [Bacteroidia bacterium]
DFVDDYAEKRSFFLYQSTLRSFNDKTSSDFNKLIKDVDKISIHLLPQNTVEQSAVLGLISSLENDGFKIMNSISKKEEGIYFYTHKERSDKTTIGIFYKKGYAGVVQLDGAIDMKYVGALKQMNPEKIGDFFGFDDLKKQFEENQNENGNE